MMKLVKDAYREWNAEVVFITSNWAGNKEIMEGCKEAGIPAFVRIPPIFRSSTVPLTLVSLLSFLSTNSPLQGTLWDF